MSYPNPFQEPQHSFDPFPPMTSPSSTQRVPPGHVHPGAYHPDPFSSASDPFSDLFQVNNPAAQNLAMHNQQGHVPPPQNPQQQQQQQQSGGPPAHNPTQRFSYAWDIQLSRQNQQVPFQDLDLHQMHNQHRQQLQNPQHNQHLMTSASSHRVSSAPAAVAPSGIAMTPFKGSPTMPQTYQQPGPNLPQRSGSFSGAHAPVPKPPRQAPRATSMYVEAPPVSPNRFTSHSSPTVALATASSPPISSPALLTQDTGLNSTWQEDVDQISSMFPHIHRSAIEEDIRKTRSKDMTVNNILDGRVSSPLAQVSTPASAPSPPGTRADSSPRTVVVPPHTTPVSRSPTIHSPTAHSPTTTHAHRTQSPTTHSPVPFSPVTMSSMRVVLPRNSNPELDDLPSYEEFESPRSGSNARPSPVVRITQRTLEEFEQNDRQIVQLLSKDIETEYQQAIRHLDALHGQLQATQARYNLLQKQSQKEYKDTLKYKKTTAKSLMAKMKGTFEEKLAKEEAEFVQAKSKEESARLEVEELSKFQEQLVNQTTYLTTQLKVLQTAQEKQGKILEALPSNPEARSLEEILASVILEKNHITQQKVSWEGCKTYVEKGYETLLQTLHELNSVESTAAMDLFTNTSLADLAKSSHMARIRNSIQRAKIALENARRYIPNIPTIQHENIISLNALIDFVFDGPLADFGNLQKIAEISAKLEVAAQNAFNALGWVNANLNSSVLPAHSRMNVAVSEAWARLKEQRVNLITQVVQNGS